MAARYVWGMYTGGVEKPAEIKMGLTDEICLKGEIGRG